MVKRYGLAALTILTGVLLFSTASSATEYMPIAALKNCVPLQQSGAAFISLTPGTTYAVTVEGNAAASAAPDAEYDGVFCFFFDDARPFHPELAFLPKGDMLEFTASDVAFYAFLVEATDKDVNDNVGFMTVTFTPAWPGGAREELMVHGIGNCFGMEDHGGAKKVLAGGDTYTASVTGDAACNADPDGFYDGVFLFYKELDRPVHPVLKVLEIGQLLSFTIHSSGWVYGCLADESYIAMVDNTGSMVVQFEEGSPVEEGSWGSIKALHR